MRLIHLSDPHLTDPEHPLAGRTHWGKRYLGLASWRRRRRYRHRREWLDRLVDAVHAAEPDQIMLTGDLTHIGLPEEIEEAGGWLSALGPPERVFLVPGNHDVYARDSWPAIEQHWGRYLPPPGAYPQLREADGIQLIGINSGVPTRPASACGLVGAQQLKGLAEHLAAIFHGPRLLAIHHPPFPGMISFRKRLRDAEALAEFAGDVDLVLHGHDHSNRYAERGHTRIYGINSASYEDGSFRLLDLERDGEGWQCRMRRYTPGSHAEALEDDSFRLRTSSRVS